MQRWAGKAITLRFIQRHFCSITISYNSCSKKIATTKVAIFNPSFGSTIFNKIVTIAAGTIPEPPKISWINCGAFASDGHVGTMP